MVTIIPETISQEKFKPYGQLIQVPTDMEPTVHNDQVTFWKQQAEYRIEEETEIGVLKVRKQNMIFDELENHYDTPTTLICLDGSFILPVAPPSGHIPSSDSLKAFYVSKGQAIILAEKCWHGATYPVDQDEITLLVIFQKDALDNDTVYKPLDQTCKIANL